jgi:hypothetical protein
MSKRCGCNWNWDKIAWGYLCLSTLFYTCLATTFTAFALDKDSYTPIFVPNLLQLLAVSSAFATQSAYYIKTINVTHVFAIILSLFGVVLSATQVAFIVKAQGTWPAAQGLDYTINYNHTVYNATGPFAFDAFVGIYSIILVMALIQLGLVVRILGYETPPIKGQKKHDDDENYFYIACVRIKIDPHKEMKGDVEQICVFVLALCVGFISISDFVLACFAFTHAPPAMPDSINLWGCVGIIYCMHDAYHQQSRDKLRKSISSHEYKDINLIFWVIGYIHLIIGIILPTYIVVKYNYVPWSVDSFKSAFVVSASVSGIDMAERSFTFITLIMTYAAFTFVSFRFAWLACYPRPDLWKTKDADKVKLLNGEEEEVDG